MDAETRAALESALEALRDDSTPIIRRLARNRIRLALEAALDNTAVERCDRFANDEAAKALYDTWSNQPGWMPWVERGNSTMQERARREVAL